MHDSATKLCEPSVPATGLPSSACAAESLIDQSTMADRGSSEQLPAAALRRRIIGPRSGWQAVNFEELWRFRELLFFLVWRDVKVRYKQTVLGAAWAVLQPLMTMIVFVVFFGKLGGMEGRVEAGTNYPVFVFAALLPWTFFAAAVQQSANSLINNSNLVSKVYFPRLLIPIAAVGGGLVDFGISFGVLLGLMLLYSVPWSSTVCLLPLFTLLTIATTVGIGTLLSALVVAYRDFRYLIGFLVQLWMFASPVGYPLAVVPARWQLLYALNPMVGIISGFRSAILGEPLRWDCIAVSSGATLLLVLVGVFYFRRVERRFADII